MEILRAKSYLSGLGQFGSQLGLERIEKICEELDNPQLKYKTIIVAGTNGKGSVSIMLSSILKEAGFHVGTYSSPALWDDRERILVDKNKIPEADFCRLLEQVKPLQEKHKATFFEVVTAVAFLYFAEKGVDYAVLEVGLGGRFDATNVAEPKVSIITNIDMDHTKVLGDTILDIAEEKAGILRENHTLITASDKQEVLDYFQKVANEKNSKLIKVKERDVVPVSTDFQKQAFSVNGYQIQTKMLGDFQMENAAAAISAAEELGIEKENILSGIENSYWPGRFEVIQENPLVILSAAHNPAATAELCKSLGHIDKKKIFVFGASNDKDIKSMLEKVSEEASEIILTSYSKSRSAKPEDISKYVKGVEYSISTPLLAAVDDAIERADENSIVVITGSIFLAGEARQKWIKEVFFETPK